MAVPDLPGFNKLVETPTGVYLVNEHDAYVGQSLLKYGEYSHGEAEVFQQLIPPGGVVFDVGANIGAHTVLFAERVGSDGKVVAFEPQRVVFQTLCANVAMRSLMNVDCYWAAVGESEGVVSVVDIDYRIDNNFGGISMDLPGPSYQVGKVRLDGFKNLNRLDFLKIDVEGMESDVIQGAQETIRKHRPIIYVENDRPEQSEKLIRAIYALGYRMYWHAPYLYRTDNPFGNPENVYKDVASFNLLCAHKEAPVKIDLREVKSFTEHPFTEMERAA